MVEPLEHAEHQTQIAPDKFLPRPHIPAVDEGKELPHPFVADDGERRGIHAADFNFADGHIVASLAFLNCIMTAVKEKYSRGAWLYLGEKRIDAKGGRNMTFSELKKKDMICIGDGRVIGRACDVVLDPATGQALGLIVCGGCGIFRSEKSQMEIPWRQIACIGDDVILVSPGSC